jgi:hypothetical protein
VWVSCLGPNNGARGGGTLYHYDPRRAGGGGFDPDSSIPFRGSPTFTGFRPRPGGSGAGDYLAYVPEQGATTGEFLRVYAPHRPGQAPAELSMLPLDRRQCHLAHAIIIPDGGKRGHMVCEGDHTGPGSYLAVDVEPGAMAVTAAVPIGVFPDGLALVPRP